MSRTGEFRLDRPLELGEARPGGSVRCHLTAEEAFPALEELILSARREVWASLRDFDPFTPVRSARARAIGKDWFDLIVHVLRRGVMLRIVLADNDCACHPEAHRRAWRARRAFASAAEAAGPKANLRVVVATHPTRASGFWRLAFLPRSRRNVGRTLARLNGLDLPHRSAMVRDMPGLDGLMKTSGDRLRPRVGLPSFGFAEHRQRLIVVDRVRLFVGCPGFAPVDKRGAWETLQLTVSGPVVAEAQRHLETFLGSNDQTGVAPGRSFLRTLSTRPRKAHLLPIPDEVVAEIAAAHEMMALRVRRLIYLETCGFSDLRLAQTLARAGRHAPGLSLILLLPDEDGARRPLVERYVIGELRRAFGARLFVGLGDDRPRDDAERRLHAAVSIFDDEMAIVSSAALTPRELRWDTGAGLQLRDRRLVRSLRAKLMRGWLGPSARPEHFEAETAVASWKTLAAADAGVPIRPYPAHA